MAIIQQPRHKLLCSFECGAMGDNTPKNAEVPATVLVHEGFFKNRKFFIRMRYGDLQEIIGHEL